MTPRFTARLTLAVLFLAAPVLHGYERIVHRRMTERAFLRLLPQLERHLGIAPGDSVGGESPSRLMSDGAYDEDRIFPDARSLHHFFDPFHLEPLTIRHSILGCGGVGFRADRWAVGDTLLNAHSIERAKTMYEDALLGPNPGTRVSAQRHLLRALGHGVHLIQDMAQPEHTRNDQHLPGSALGSATAASIWESWGKVNLARFSTAAVSFDGYPDVVLPTYKSYFHTSEGETRWVGRGLADYSNRNFVTQDTNYHDNVPSWPCRPIARCLLYEEPRIEAAVPRTLRDQSEGIMELVPQADGTFLPTPRVVTVDYQVYTSFPHDDYLGVPDTDVFHTFHSSFDQESRLFACGPLYSLGDGSYLTRASLLVPRAVGYSAGFIKHFFRGDIEADWTPDPISGGYYMKLTNKSTESLGSDTTVEAVFEADPQYFDRTNSDDTGVIVPRRPLSDLVSGFDGISPGESILVKVTPFGLKPEDSILEFSRKIVLRGTLGDEPDAVVGLYQRPSNRTRRTLHFNQPGTTPYFQLRNFGAAQIYFISRGALAYAHSAFQTTSGVYMNAHRGGSFTFVWHQEAFASRFRLINGDQSARVHVYTSTNVFHDQFLTFSQDMAPFEERTIELPEGTARFTVGSNLGYVAMDDVSWEYVP